jgi:hypothetical protein
VQSDNAFTEDLLDYNDTDFEGKAIDDEVDSPHAALTNCVGSFRPYPHGLSDCSKQQSQVHTGYPIGTACQGSKYLYFIDLVAPSNMLLAIDILIICIGIICLCSLFNYYGFKCTHSDSEYILIRYYGALSLQHSIVTLLLSDMNSQIALDQGKLIFNYNSDLG